MLVLLVYQAFRPVSKFIAGVTDVAPQSGMFHPRECLGNTLKETIIKYKTESI